MKAKKKKIMISSIVIVVLAIVFFASFNVYSFKKALNKMNEPQVNAAVPSKETSGKALQEDPFSILLLGIDERENDSGRTDTMIVATVNPALGTIKMLSIPRDSRVEIIGNNTTEKINHAYTRGGIAMSVATVENMLSIPIDHYVAVNMEGFLSIIDVVDGIDVKNDLDLTHRTYHFPKGEISLGGEEALVFSRIRYEDPRGDFGRQIRQKQLLEALFAEAKNPKMFLQLNDIFEVLGDNVKMNFSTTQLMDLQKLYGKLNKDIEQLQFEHGEGKRIDTYWYYILDEAELAEVSGVLKAHLESVE